MDKQITSASHEWIDQLLADKQNILPKQRDLLAMLAASLVDNADAMEQYAQRAKENGATEQEVARMMEIGNAAAAQIARAPDLARDAALDNASATAQADAVAPRS